MHLSLLPAQDRMLTFKGHVHTRLDAAAAAMVEVQVEGLPAQTIMVGRHGAFRLQAPAGLTTTLTFSCAGARSKTIRIDAMHAGDGACRSPITFDVVLHDPDHLADASGAREAGLIRFTPGTGSPRIHFGDVPKRGTRSMEDIAMMRFR